MLIDLLRGGIVDPLKLYGTVKGKLRLSLGRLRGEWEQRLFPRVRAAAPATVVRSGHGRC